jgi:hypothetical protein
MNIQELSSSQEIMLQWQNGQASSSASGSTKNSTNSSLNLFTANTSMTSQVAGMVELTKYVMDAMGLAPDSRVTFSLLSEYREQLRSEFTRGVTDGLKALEVENLDSLKFTLQIKDDGTVNVAADSPDKDSIQNFFDNSPELIKKYRQIEALNGIDTARQSLAIAPGEMRKRIQIEGMASWWSASDDAKQTFGAYSGQKFSLLEGINLTV